MKSIVSLASPARWLCLTLLPVLAWPPDASAQDGVRLELTRDEDVMGVQWTPERGVLQMSSGIAGDWLNVAVESPSWFQRGGSVFFRVLDVENPDTIQLEAGVDLYQSQGLMPLMLPPGFFGPGSQPFEGTVQFRGNPLGTRGAFELGSTDTIVQRRESSALPPPPSNNPLPVELVALSLVSVNPITVTFNGGGSQPYWVYLQPGTLSPTDNTGQMTLKRSDTSSGTFDVQLPIAPILVFSNATDSRTMTLPLQLMTGSSGVFSASGPCATDPLRVPRLPLGLCMQNLQLHGPQLQLFLTAPTASFTRPPANIMPGAVVDPAVASLGRFATISGGAHIGPQDVVGPYAFIGANVFVGSNVLIGAGVMVGDGTVIGDNSVIDDGTHIGPFSVIGSNAVVGGMCQLGDQVRIGSHTRLGGGSLVGPGAQLGNHVTCGNGVVLGPECKLVDGLHLVEGAQVGPGIVLDQHLLWCSLSHGTKIIATPAQCETQNGAVLGLLSTENRFLRTVPTAVKKVTPLTWNPTNPPAGLTNLQDDVNKAGAGTTNGPIKDRTWTTNTYDCDDFARDLEEALEALGYDATFTVYWHTVPNPHRSWWNVLWETAFIEEAHALTDVHTKDGLIWIEPQTGEVGVDLDFDGDGKVGYDTKNGGKNTDNSGRIEVYDSRAAAEKAGVIMD